MNGPELCISAWLILRNLKEKKGKCRMCIKYNPIILVLETHTTNGYVKNTQGMGRPAGSVGRAYNS